MWSSTIGWVILRRKLKASLFLTQCYGTLKWSEQELLYSWFTVLVISSEQFQRPVKSLGVEWDCSLVAKYERSVRVADGQGVIFLCHELSSLRLRPRLPNNGEVLLQHAGELLMIDTVIIGIRR